MIGKKTVILALAILFLFSCSTDKINPFGLENVANTSLGKVEHVLKYGAEQEQTVAFPVSYVKDSDDLLIGKYREYESAILIKFGEVTNELSSVTVKKVNLFLSPKYKFKESSSTPLSVNIHQVTMAWDEETIEPTEVLNNYNPVVLSNGILPDSVTIRDSLDLGTDLIQRWIDRTDDNNGLLLLAPSADHMAVYDSEETSNIPLLKVVYEQQGQLDSSFFSATEGLSVIRSSYQIPPNRLAVGSGVGFVTYFKLNYTDIPRKASINRATLELQVDTLNSLHQDFIYEFSQLKAGSDDWLNSPELADSSSYDTTHYRGGSLLRINIKNAVQDWVNRDGNDYGIRIAPLHMGDGLFRTIIYSSSVEDSLLRPKLEIYYSIPPTLGQ